MNVNPETGQPMASGSWFSRNWKWVVGLGCGLPLLCCLGSLAVGGAGAFGLVKSIQDNAVVKDAKQRIKNHPVAQDEVGSPVDVSGFPVTNISAGTSETHVELMFVIRGPKGSAQVFANGVQKGETITYSKLELVNAKQERIDLRDKSEQGEPALEHLDPSEPAPHEPPMPDVPEDE